MSASKTASAAKAPKNSLASTVRGKLTFTAKKFWKTRFLFALFLPALAYFILFKYLPMWGIRMAWYKYSMFGGWERSTYVGWRYFRMFFETPRWWTYTFNTLALGCQSVFICFPLTVVFALMMNEIRNLKFKKCVQTVSYLPHFMSTVVVVALMRQICDPTTGLLNMVIQAFGGEPIKFFLISKYFRPMYLISTLWQGLGWATIVYLAAIAGVDPGLYEAARLDGAGRWRQIWNITLPSIMPTVTTLFIMEVGHVLGDSMEKVLLMQEATTWDVSMTLSTYSFDLGFNNADYGYSTAVNFMTNIVNLCMVLIANKISKKVTDSGIF